MLLAATISMGISNVAMAKDTTVSLSKLKLAVSDVKLRVWIIERCTADAFCDVIPAAPPNGDDSTIEFVRGELTKEIAIRNSKNIRTIKQQSKRAITIKGKTNEQN